MVLIGILKIGTLLATPVNEVAQKQRTIPMELQTRLLVVIMENGHRVSPLLIVGAVPQ